MNIGIIGGGINGLCSALAIAQMGHNVTVYERGKLMNETSSASSKLLHGGLRYLENREFRLVKEALRERDAWIKRVPSLAKPIKLILPIYKSSRRGKLLIGLGLFFYELLAGKTILPKSKWLSRNEILNENPDLNCEGLKGGYEFSDGQMDDYLLGIWIAEQCKKIGVNIKEHFEISTIKDSGKAQLKNGELLYHDKLINITGPWAIQLSKRSGISIPYELDLIRGSHLIIQKNIKNGFLLEVPNEERIFFVLPWKNKTLIGTTEVRQSIKQPINCSEYERNYLLSAYQNYFPDNTEKLVESFAGVRPLISSHVNPSKATREYAIYKHNNLITVLGGKWTTAMSLGNKVAKAL